MGTPRKATNDYVTAGAAAKIMRVSAKTIHRLCEVGMLSFWRMPTGLRERRIMKSELQRYMKENGLPTDLLEVTGGTK